MSLFLDKKRFENTWQSTHVDVQFQKTKTGQFKKSPLKAILRIQGAAMGNYLSIKSREGKAEVSLACVQKCTWQCKRTRFFLKKTSFPYNISIRTLYQFTSEKFFYRELLILLTYLIIISPNVKYSWLRVCIKFTKIFSILGTPLQGMLV